ncbi:MAG: thioredoxin family protein [Pirellulales bacterium]|nr:thioredoxin family protein [Pirellulales bacterium]
MYLRIRRLATVAVAVLLCFGGVACSDANVPASIHAERTGVEFISDYQQARVAARRTGKPLLVVVRTRWCPFSHELIHESFADREVVQASSRFVCAVVDAEEQPELCRQLTTAAVYPSVHFLTANGTELNHFHGSRKPAELLDQIESAARASARLPLSLRIYR